MPRFSPSTPTFQPLGKHALVRLLPEPARSASLAVITSASLTQRAEVLALGQGLPDLNVGDVVLCRPAQGHEIGDHLLLPSTAILATETPA